MIGTAVISAFWLGILTAISPCPLATNIAAVSFIGRKAGHKYHVLLSGFLYAVGRTIIYILLGAGIMAGMLGNAEVSRFLQQYINEILGPVLIVLGLILLDWIGSGVSLTVGTDALREKAKTGGIWWALPIGGLFALSFCPVSAGLFFGGLLPLALKENSMILLPAAFGIGTSLPVVVFACLLAVSSNWAARLFNRVTRLEVLVRYVAGTAFILAGVYYCLTHIYGMTFF